MTPLTDRRPTLLIVTYGLIAGGGETFPIFLANELRRRAWPVAFLDSGFEPPEPGMRELLARNVPLYHLVHQDDVGPLCRQLGVEIVHSCHTTTDLMVSKSLDRFPADSRPRHVVTLHGGYETLGLETLLIHLGQVKAVDQFVYTAAKNLRSFPDQFLARSRFVRIPNALPASASAPQERAALGITTDGAIVAMLVSRAIPGKGWQLAIEAVEDARVATGRDIHLALIGRGPVYDDIRSTSAPGWLHLLGVQGDIRSWISIADVGLLPSTFSGESYPLVLIDFLTMGVPVIASAAGEIPEMMACALGTPGYIVDETDDIRLEEEVAGRLTEFVALDAKARSDLRARALAAAEKFSFAEMVDSYEQVYEQAYTG